MASKNVAARKIMVNLMTGTGGFHKNPPLPCKILTISEKVITMRPVHPNRPYDMPIERFSLRQGDHHTLHKHDSGRSFGWAHIDDAGKKIIYALYNELFPGSCPVARDGIHQRGDVLAKCNLCGDK